MEKVLRQYLFEILCENYTAHIFVAKIATIRCVTRPVAVWVQFLQPLAAANFSCKFCNQQLKLPLVVIFCTQQLQLPLVIIFAPHSCSYLESSFFAANSCSRIWFSILHPMGAIFLLFFCSHQLQLKFLVEYALHTQLGANQIAQWPLFSVKWPFLNGHDTYKVYCHAIELLVTASHLLDLSNELHNVSEVPLIQK